MTRVLVLGATGMLGHAVFKSFGEDARYEAWGTTRGAGGSLLFAKARLGQIFSGIDVLDQDSLIRVLNSVRPDVLINCVGLVKQLSDAGDPLVALPINAMLPHRLARLGGIAGMRVVHVSTDCVFSGRSGPYREHDKSDADDLYGKSKYLGELNSDMDAVTLRTSIIGHELTSRHGLIEWFLSQEGPVRGYAKAVFSGLPTVELARVMRDFVVPHRQLTGLYHVSAKPISKLDLLRLVASVYGKQIAIEPDDSVVLNRSLNADRFFMATGYRAPDWPQLVEMMRDFQ